MKAALAGERPAEGIVCGSRPMAMPRTFSMPSSPRGYSPIRNRASADAHDRAGHPAQSRRDGVSTHPTRDLPSASCSRREKAVDWRKKTAELE